MTVLSRAALLDAAAKGSIIYCVETEEGFQWNASCYSKRALRRKLKLIRKYLGCKTFTVDK